jgi:alpha-D-ribose 1-methylphosphonate 5-triphosphate synthase subunit PhnH
MNVVMLGRNLAMMEMGSAPLKDAGHEVILTLSDIEAMTMLQTGTHSALVFGMAVEQSAREVIKNFVATNQLQVKLLEPLSPMDLPDLLEALKN